MASDSLVGDGLALSPWQESQCEIASLKAELKELRTKEAMAKNLFFGPHRGHAYTEDNPCSRYPWEMKE
jgi:hypothetical protein